MGERLFEHEETLHAPELVGLEVSRVLRRCERERALAPASAGEALADLVALSLKRYSHCLLLPRAWELRRNRPVCDGAHVTLAEFLDTPLLTRDPASSRAPPHRPH